MAFLSQSSVIRLYKNVIDDTIASSREAFLDEGVDEQVLIELKTLWESKVTSNKAVQITPPEQVAAGGTNTDQLHQGTSAGNSGPSGGGSSAGASTSTNRKSQPVKRNTTEQQQQSTTTQPVASNNVYQQQQQAGTSQQNLTTNGSGLILPGGVGGTTKTVTNTITNNNSNTNTTQQQQTQQVVQHQQMAAPTQLQQTMAAQQTMFSPMLDPTKVVPIQITLPPSTGMQETTGRVLTIQVPATALIGNQLQQVLTGPVISATMRLPQQQASNLLQQHVNAALQGQNSPLLAKAIPQVDGSLIDSDQEQDQDLDQVNIEFPDIFALAHALNICNDLTKQKQRKQQIKRIRKIHSKHQTDENSITNHTQKNATIVDTNINTSISISNSSPLIQLDGQNFEHGLLEDSSEDEDDVSDEVSEDEELDEDKEDEDVDIDGGGMEEEPLNSEDDVSEEDPTDLFDTENVVVCQYDKINRSRNKWKFYLKDGIMNLDGKDFIFQKITGDAEW